MKDKKRIGEVLVERGVLSAEALAAILEEHAKESGRLGESLLGKGLVSKEDLGTALQYSMGVPYVGGLPGAINPKVLALVPAAVARQCCALPLNIEEDSRLLVVAMAEPQNMAHISEIQFSAGMKVSPRFSFRSDLLAAIQIYYDEVPAEPSTVAAVEIPPPAPLLTYSKGRSSWSLADCPCRAAAIATFCIALLGGWAAGYTMSGHASSPVRMPAVAAGPAVPAAAPVVTPEVTPAPSVERVPLPVIEAQAPAATLPAPVSAEDSGYMLQIGVFRSKENAERLVEALREKHDEARLLPLATDLFSVNIGPFADRVSAARNGVLLAAELNVSPLIVKAVP